jgi:hypothetical protein
MNERSHVTIATTNNVDVVCGAVISCPIPFFVPYVITASKPTTQEWTSDDDDDDDVRNGGGTVPELEGDDNKDIGSDGSGGGGGGDASGQGSGGVDELAQLLARHGVATDASLTTTTTTTPMTAAAAAAVAAEKPFLMLLRTPLPRVDDSHNAVVATLVESQRLLGARHWAVS